MSMSMFLALFAVTFLIAVVLLFLSCLDAHFHLSLVFDTHVQSVVRILFRLFQGLLLSALLSV